jgi:hypothetical protein
MGWTIYLWAIAALLVLPLPFKIAEYILGKDKSPKAVKIEEMANAVFFFVGLVGLYGFVYHVDILGQVFWRTWVVLAIALSIAGMIWSPKLKYATLVLGKTRARVVIATGFLAFVPMLVGLWRTGA